MPESERLPVDGDTPASQAVFEASQAPPAASSIVRRVNYYHIMIRAANPGSCTHFAETMQLPVAWPLTSPREGAVTGGVGVGNVNLETVQFPGQTEQQPRLLGFAFEPRSLDESLRQLTLRSLCSGRAAQDDQGAGRDGSKGVCWDERDTAGVFSFRQPRARHGPRLSQ